MRPRDRSEDRQSATWVWLSSPDVDFGRGRNDRAGDERTVWLHADPFAALGLPRSADPDAVRRAYRRLARVHHPDTASTGDGSTRRFEELRDASKAIRGEMEVSVEPARGAWWRFVGFAEPGPLGEADLAVAGLTFELGELTRVPVRRAEDTIRISYGSQSVPLSVRYAGSRLAAPVLLARAGAVAESAFLVLLCLALIPVVALLLALDVYVLSDLNDALTWVSALAVLGAGYGALAAILSTAGRPIPTPRRAVLRTRATVGALRSLPRGRA